MLPGGESEGRRRAEAWLGGGLARYHESNDDLAGDETSRLSPYLHFGCLSPRALVAEAGDAGGPGADAFVRQLCWRDFHHQVLTATPGLPRDDYRSRGDRWRHDDDHLAAWKEGRTGYPVVDAGMRQLAAEGSMHNRARLVTVSFLTKDLYLDWRLGAAHFWDLLADGDMANNAGNWQWVAGTGNDTRPNGCSTRYARPTASTPTGPTSAAMSPSWPASRARRCTNPGGFPRGALHHRLPRAHARPRRGCRRLRAARQPASSKSAGKGRGKATDDGQLRIL